VRDHNLLSIEEKKKQAHVKTTFFDGVIDIYMLQSQRTANYVTNSKVWSETFIKNKIGNACITKH